METKLTPGQQFAEKYGNGAVEEMLKTITLAKRLALAIVAAVMAVSYQHQRHYLLAQDMDWFGASVTPLIIDALTLLCVKVLGATGMARTAKVIALTFLLAPVGASAWINFNGSPNATVGWIYVTVVAFIAVAEVIKAFIKPDFDSILAEEARVQPARKIGRKLTQEQIRERADKTAATKERKRVEREREERRMRRQSRKLDAALEEAYSMPSAPVSPAPGQ
jgi:hypothetical protein